MGIVRPDQSSSGGGGGGSVTVTDGTHSVANVTTLDFTAGVTVSDAGGGQANASVTAGAPTFTPTATKTANYTAAAGEYVVGDSTAGAFTVTLPAAPANGTLVAVQQIGSANAITVAAGVGDTINATTNSSLGTTRRSALYEYRSSDKVWFAIAPATNPVLSAAAFDGSIVAHGTATAPTFSTGTLDAIATAQPPSAAVPLNAQKITGLAVATAGTDAASLANSLDQFGVPAANVAWNAKKITGLAAATANGDAGRWEQLPAGIMTASGDIIYASGANTPARLAKGADGTVLTLAAGVPSWAASAAGGAIPQVGALVNGALAATLPRYVALGQSPGGTSGTLYMYAITLQSGVAITSVSFLSSGALSVGTHQIFGIFDDSLGSSSATPYALLATSTDDTSTAWAGNTVKTLNLTPGTYTPGRTGIFYVGVLITATTANTFRGALADSVYGALASNTGGASNTGISALPNPATAPTFGGGSIAAAWVK